MSKASTISSGSILFSQLYCSKSNFPEIQFRTHTTTALQIRNFFSPNALTFHCYRRGNFPATTKSIASRPIITGRSLTTTPLCAYKTVEEAKSRHRSGPYSATAGILFLVTGIGLIFYFRHEKARMERKRVAEATKGVGRPKVGGSFELINQDGETWSSENMTGRYSLVYFGFSHCPDICPDELDKMAKIVDLVNATPLFSASAGDKENSVAKNAINNSKKALPPLLPIFITCDPARDTPAVLKEYLSEFHRDLIGLTGTWDQIRQTCKKYRVYFSTPEGVQKGQDYLVDHSIYFYLMDPDGDFVEAIGKEFSPQRAAKVISAHAGDWVRGDRGEK